VALVRKAADDTRVTIFLQSFEENKINELVVTSNKLTNNFAGLITIGLGPMWPAGRKSDCLNHVGGEITPVSDITHVMTRYQIADGEHDRRI
jgi:hypothetical protein